MRTLILITAILVGFTVSVVLSGCQQVELTTPDGYHVKINTFCMSFDLDWLQWRDLIVEKIDTDSAGVKAGYGPVKVEISEPR